MRARGCSNDVRHMVAIIFAAPPMATVSHPHLGYSGTVAIGIGSAAACQSGRRRDRYRRPHDAPGLACSRQLLCAANVHLGRQPVWHQSSHVLFQGHSQPKTATPSARRRAVETPPPSLRWPQFLPSLAPVLCAGRARCAPPSVRRFRGLRVPGVVVKLSAAVSSRSEATRGPASCGETSRGHV